MKKVIISASIVLLSLPLAAFALVAQQPDDYETDEGIYCPNISQTLRRGMRDVITSPQGQVSELQYFITDYYDLQEDAAVSGFFGRMTQQYIVRFQQEHGLPAFGTVGVLTRAKIKQVCGVTTQPVCNSYPKPSCSPNQRLEETGRDSRGCPTLARCVEITPGKVSLRVSHFGNKTTYAPGEQIAFEVKGTEDFDGNAATPEEGYNVQVHLSIPGVRDLEGINATYNPSTGYWSARLSAPTDVSQIYKVTATLYCSNHNLVCAQRVNVSSGPMSQVETSFSFSLSGGVTSSLSVLSPNGGELLYTGNTQTIRWNPGPSQSGKVTLLLHGYTAMASSNYPIEVSEAIAYNVPNSGSYQWVVPEEYGLGWKQAMFKVAVRDEQTKQTDYSDAGFSISMGSATNSVPFSQPPAGQQYTQGQALPLMWANHGASGQQTRITLLRKSDTSYGRFFFTEGDIWGVQKWTIPTDIPSAPDYYVRVAQTIGDPGKGATIRVGYSNIFAIGSGSNSGITVTAPNGGERWERSVLNSITWTPYSYNPDVNPSRTMDAFLEKKNPDGSFTVLGSVIPSGKASIHWMTGFTNDGYKEGFVEPGDNFYIRVLNKLTGASDRSDAPFTIVPPLLSLKVNGSEGPVTVANGQAVDVAWSVTSGLTGCYISGTFNGGYPINVLNNGSMSVRIDTQGVGPTTFVHLSCTQGPVVGGQYDPSPLDTTSNGKHAITKIVSLIVIGAPQVPASISITSPNGGEQLNPESQIDVQFAHSGLKSYSAALYRNDQWQAWILKDQLIPSGSPSVLSASPVRYYIPNISAPENSGAVWKIYMTGQRADGTGYIDDKSDMPFSFTSSVKPILSIASPGNNEVITRGKQFRVQWAQTGLDSDVVNVTVSNNAAEDHLAAFVPAKQGYADVIIGSSGPSAYIKGDAVIKVWVTNLKDGDPRAVSAQVRVTVNEKEVSFSATGPNILPAWKAKSFSPVNGKRYCFGGQYVAQSPKYPGAWIGAESCNDATDDQYKLYMSDSENGTYYQIADTAGHGQDHCELVNPSFSIPNEDDIKSGGCATCDIQNMNDPQQELVFSRANFGQPFRLVKSSVWSDLSSQIYKCGVLIPPAGANAVAKPQTQVASPYESFIWVINQLKTFGQ